MLNFNFNLYFTKYGRWRKYFSNILIVWVCEAGNIFLLRNKKCLFECDLDSNQILRMILLVKFCTHAFGCKILSSLMGKSLKPIEIGGHFKYIHNNMSWTPHYFWKPNTVHQTKAGKKQDKFIFLFISCL